MKKEWQYRAEIDEQEKRYKIIFIRKIDEWYDEVRCDSHEIRAGVWKPLPHIHLKMGTHTLEPLMVLEKAKKIVEEYIPMLEEIFTL